MSKSAVRENACVEAYVRGWRQSDDGSWFRSGTPDDAITLHHPDDDSDHGYVLATTPEDAVRIDRETFSA